MTQAQVLVDEITDQVARDLLNANPKLLANSSITGIDMALEAFALARDPASNATYIQDAVSADPGKFIWNSPRLEQARDNFNHNSMLLQIKPKGVKLRGVKCGKCGSESVVAREMQLRSRDEPMDVLVTCVSCNNRWKLAQ